MAREFHLFAGIGGGIYGGLLLGNHCVGSVEINDYCNQVLRQRQLDGWLDEFPIYGDLLQLNGHDYIGDFDILCGGFPCQAFSHAAHGDNIPEKNLWPEMFRFVIESHAPIVFGENVTLKAITTAKQDLERIGYNVRICRLGCEELGADHRRHRFWLLATNHQETFNGVREELRLLPIFKNNIWVNDYNLQVDVPVMNRREQLKAVGNAQSPLVAACAFRILANRFDTNEPISEFVTEEELNNVIEINNSWIRTTFGNEFGLVHTPTTMANYSAPSMMKHQGCRNFVEVFGRPSPKNAEYLMGFPLGASSLAENNMGAIQNWLNQIR